MLYCLATYSIVSVGHKFQNSENSPDVKKSPWVHEHLNVCLQKMSTKTNIPGGYGLCPACGGKKTSENWCPPCHARLLLDECSGLTSGDKNLDEFIRKTITDARRSYDYFEWIPFENFKDIKQIGRGGFATAYSATRTNCRKGHFDWDEKTKKYVRGSWKNYKVALKSFHNTPDIASTFLNEIKTHHKCMMLQEDEFLQCYGISRNPVTKEFITVLDYAQQGDLRHFLQKNHETLKWEDRLRIVTKIAKDLKVIHSTGLIHGDFHSGNVLQESTIPKVSDFGLSRVDKDHIPEADEIAATRDRAIQKHSPEAIYTSRLIHYVTKKQDTCNDTKQQDLYINTSLQNLCNDTRQQDLYLNDMTE
ncbi:3276_t:CDS:2 [Funneliformis mosseae]|uniref:3276_t:CDS:1 n=1 Tax=Funneliformis mosseae TaxID=27381 RepID=A0A9N8VHJ1_FUNMO|nr:3276_t:CDS:2 [Funneliformis mosseae]